MSDPSSDASPGPDALPPPRWTRLLVAPGIELHVRDDARLPDSPAEREVLLETIELHLKALRRR